MKCGLLYLLLGVFALASLMVGPCCAQDQRASASSATDPGQGSVPKVVRLAFLGDLMLGGDVSRSLRDQPPERFWGDTLPILRQADAVIANLEGPITTSGRRWQSDWKFFHFRADPAAVRILAAGNVRLGRTRAEAPRILEVRPEGRGDLGDRPDAGLRRDPRCRRDELPRRQGRRTRARLDRPVGVRPETRRSGADRSFPALGARSADRAERRFPPLRPRRHRARRRLIHGHSAHVVQAIERYRHGIILYDTGNFIDDYWEIPLQRTTWSFIFRLTVENGRPASLQLLPVLTHPFLAIATGELFHSIAETMRSRCAAFGTTVFGSTEGLDIPLH